MARKHPSDKLLAEYSAKRSFAATPEPPPAPAPGRGPLLFMLQMHAASRLHYDFRLECDGVLKSWAIPKGPSMNPADKRLAVPTEDHPYAYASFEGVIPPKQYGAGEVIVWDCGVYSPDGWNEPDAGTHFHDREEAERRVRAGLAAGKLSFQLRGTKLKGSFALVRTKDPKAWLLIKHKDAFVSTSDITQQDRSPLSQARVTEVAAMKLQRLEAERLAPAGRTGPIPAKLPPMLAELGQEAFDDPQWRWEPKLDGYRALAHFTGRGVKLLSRRAQDYTGTFPALAAELAAQGVPGTVLDGEIVALDPQGRPSFNALQNRAGLKTAGELAKADAEVPAIYYAFDIPFFAGVDLRERPYHERRRYLEQCVLPGPRVQPVHATQDGLELHRVAVEAGFEGVVGKRIDGRWETGRRSGAWMKVKPVQSAEFVVGGYTLGRGARADFGALLVGVQAEGGLQYVTNVGTGFDEKMIQDLLKRLKPLERKACPFSKRPPGSSQAIWVEPKLVAELKFHEWTPDDSLRAPVFLRLRNDLDPKKVTKAQRPTAVASKKGNSPSPPRKRGPSLPGATRLDSRFRGNDGNAPSPRRKPGPSAEGKTLGPGFRRGDAKGDDILAQLDTPRPAFTLEVEGHRIPLSNLDRIYWPADPALKSPAITKRDLLRYLAQVAPLMLPHLADRPLTMIRMPEGIHGERFFQKHWEHAMPEFVERITIWSSHNERSTEYMLCNNLPTLLWLGQFGTLEFHIWHSRAKPGKDSPVTSTEFAGSEANLEGSILNYPDYVIFDIDPYIYSGQEKKGEEPALNTIAFEKGKEVAFKLRELLQSMTLEPIVKTSGKTGLHVFVPIRRTIDFDAARHVSELVGRHLMRLNPKDITMEWSIPKRTGKIFMDYNMNVRGKTLNVAYSPRGAPGGPVSMPLTWEQLGSAHPLDFRMSNAPALLAKRGDLWREALTKKQDLERALKTRA